MYDSIIFDLDGTLWDSTDAAAVIWREVAVEFDEIKDEITADKLRSLYGQPLEDIAIKLLPSVPKERALDIMWESTKRQCPYLIKDGGNLYPGLINTLTALKEKYRLFIVSNCEEGYIQCFLEAHKLHDFFEDFEYPGRSRLLKAENIKLVIERNGLKNPVYVGDTQGDANSSLKAGVPFVYARYGFGDVKEYDTHVDSLEELSELLL
ncbi:MAG: HAD family hydrolase [Anaerocolumna sp.]